MDLHTIFNRKLYEYIKQEQEGINNLLTENIESQKFEHTT